MGWWSKLDFLRATEGRSPGPCSMIPRRHAGELVDVIPTPGTKRDSARIQRGYLRATETRAAFQAASRPRITGPIDGWYRCQSRVGLHFFDGNGETMYEAYDRWALFFEESRRLLCPNEDGSYGWTS